MKYPGKTGIKHPEESWNLKACKGRRKLREGIGIQREERQKLFRQKLKKNPRKFPVAMRIWETPVLIPNTKVKLYAADDTALETMWESRWLPE